MLQLRILLLISVISFAGNSQPIQEVAVNNYFTQAITNRTAAEWEPAIGTMIVWPLSVPYKLVVELAKDNHLYTLVANDSSKREAEKWYNQWGIEPASNTFIYAPQGVDAWWTRDWGPNAVFTPDGKMKLGDGKYIYSTPSSGIGCDDSLVFLYKTKDNEIIKTQVDDNATIALAKGLNLEVIDLPFINTGGNVLTDGLGTAFSTCVILNENKFFNVPKEVFFQLNKELSGFNTYHILSNFEKSGIQHIDCLMKLLDEERILVAEPPKDHALYSIYESIIEQELKKMKSVYGRSYEIVRIQTDRYDKDKLAAYTNSIIINKTIYVPLFQIDEDKRAIETWQKAMPGYTVKGFTFSLDDEPVLSSELKKHYSTGYGWNNGDALHCRTRAVWDSEMLFISVKRMDGEVNSKNRNIVNVIMIDYSKEGLVTDQTNVFWRVAGEFAWQSIPLTQADKPEHFFAEIPYHQKGATVEYYVAASSHSGRVETQPRTAPNGFYQFKIK